MNTISWIFFLLGSMAIVIVSKASLLYPRTHGFYRFFAWEVLLVMLVSNMTGWFYDLLAWHQIVSWLLLIVSILLVILGVKQLMEIGRQDPERSNPSLLGMEKTARLVTVGLFRYIRHPLYSSLLFLGWGIFFKSPSWLDAGLALLCTLFLIATARAEEIENVDYFGDEYQEYMRHTSMFIPFIF